MPISTAAKTPSVVQICTNAKTPFLRALAVLRKFWGYQNDRTDLADNMMHWTIFTLPILIEPRRQPWKSFCKSSKRSKSIWFSSPKPFSDWMCTLHTKYLTYLEIIARFRPVRRKFLAMNSSSNLLRNYSEVSSSEKEILSYEFFGLSS